MLHNMAVAFNAVLPSFLIIAVGMLIRRRGLVGETALNQFNSVAFRVFLAAQLFKNVYDSSVAESFDLRLTVFLAMAVLLAAALPRPPSASRPPISPGTCRTSAGSRIAA